MCYRILRDVVDRGTTEIKRGEGDRRDQDQCSRKIDKGLILSLYGRKSGNVTDKGTDFVRRGTNDVPIEVVKEVQKRSHGERIF